MFNIQNNLNKLKWIVIGLGCFSFFNVIGGTTNASWYENIEGSVEGGVNWLNTHHTTEIISLYESDSVRVNSINNNGTWKAGAGYYLMDNLLKQRNYLNHFLFEINVYQISGNINGDVWQYELPEFNNYRFQADFKSTRLMFDFKPFLFTYNHVSPYLILGIGSAWNKLSYMETIKGADVPNTSNLLLGAHTEAKLAGELGIGLSIPLTKQLNFTGEYIYAFMGHASPKNLSTNSALLKNGPNFSFQTQSLLFGFNIRM